MKKFIYIFLLIPLFSYGQAYDFRLEEARRFIAVTYGDLVKYKAKPLTKFGFNPDITTAYETVWYTGGNETYATGNTIDSLSSSNINDNQVVSIEGHTISGNEVTFVVQTATLNGQNPIVLTTPLYRCTRLENIGSTNFEGTIYVYSGGAVSGGTPSVTDSIHLTVPVNYNRSQKASTSISSEDYWVITQTELEVGTSSGNNRTVDGWIEVREQGGVFQRIYPLTGSNYSNSDAKILSVPIIVRPGSDVRVVANSSGAGTQVKAVISGYLAIITNN